MKASHPVVTYYRIVLVCFVTLVSSSLTAAAPIRTKQANSLRFEHLTIGPVADRNSARCIFQDSKGFSWFGTSHGLLRYDGYSFFTFRFRKADSSSLPNDTVNSLHEDPPGFLLIGTPGGTSKYDETRGSMRRVDENRTHSSLDSKDDVRRVAASKGGSAWAGIIESNPELNSVNVLSEGPSGELWIGTQRGLVAINALRRSGSHYEHDPDDPATLAGNDIISLFEDRSGLLWIGLRQGGVDKLDLSGMHDSRLSRSFVPPVALTAFMIYDNSNWNFVQGSESFDSVQISYKDRFFAMAFAALDYREPAKNRYQFLLDGYDKDWVSSGVNHYARYTDVPPGIYMFRVKGTGRDGVWNELETPLRIVITPPFWKTPWFYSLVAICAVGMIITLNRFRVRSEVKRMVELERVRAAENRKVRQRAADDFHDEFGHKLTKISLLSQVIKRNLVDGQTAHREQIDKIIQTCDELSTSMRDFLWSLSPEKDSAGDIAIRLKDFGDGIFNGTGIAFRMNGTENGIDTVQLGVDWRRHLLLIFKEAMNNAAKHSGCRNVTLDVHSNNGDLFVRLVDDGKGFDSSRAAPGQGLNGMERRAEKMGGVLRIESGNGHGTTVEFSGKVDSGPTGKS